MIDALVSIELGRPHPDLDALIAQGLAKQVIFGPSPRYILTREGRALLNHLRDSTEMGIVSVVDSIMKSLEIPK